MNNKIERDIIKNSEYIIHYFSKERKKEVTNLMLEKLLYFLEAIYMALTKENYLYEEDFYAWDFGPVNKRVYDTYKEFGRMPIKLEKNIHINEENQRYIEVLYALFKDYSTFDLVNLSHSKDSPWYKINKEYNGNISDKKIIIEKDATKIWFSGIIQSSVKEQEQNR